MHGIKAQTTNLKPQLKPINAMQTSNEIHAAIVVCE